MKKYINILGHKTKGCISLCLTRNCAEKKFKKTFCVWPFMREGKSLVFRSLKKNFFCLCRPFETRLELCKADKTPLGHNGSIKQICKFVM